jgi:hypothetical protein
LGRAHSRRALLRELNRSSPLFPVQTLGGGALHGADTPRGLRRGCEQTPLDFEEAGSSWKNDQISAWRSRSYQNCEGASNPAVIGVNRRCVFDNRRK